MHLYYSKCLYPYLNLSAEGDEDGSFSLSFIKLFGRFSVSLWAFGAGLWLSVAFQPKNLGTAHRGAALTQLGGQPGEANLKNTVTN